MEPYLLDATDPHAIERYLAADGFVAAGDRPLAIERAGAGNMNLTLRVTTTAGRSFIVKQGRPWVEKYPHIAAPFERTLVESAFYETVQGEPRVAGRMPSVLRFDAVNHVLLLQDMGRASDFTTMYATATLPAAALADLLDWLDALSRVRVPAACRDTFANRSMRALNHEHIFRVPLAADNGLDLDAMTPGLRAAADELSRDARYCDAVAALGRRYTSDGAALVHGDYFPGSWLDADGGVRVIDPEFCFLGDPEFDLGVLAAHLTLARAPSAPLDAVSASVAARGLDRSLVAAYAGVEIMRRLIGVAQLPLLLAIDRKRELLDRSRRLVVEPHRGFA